MFDSGGTETRAACGGMIRAIVCLCDMPIICTASHYPRGTARIAARMTSDAPVTLFVGPNGVNWEGGGLSGPAWLLPPVVHDPGGCCHRI